MKKIEISDLRPTEDNRKWVDRDGNQYFLREGQTLEEFVDEVNSTVEDI